MVKSIIRADGSLAGKIYIRVTSKLEKQITTTVGYWSIIINIKHPSIEGGENHVKETLRDPDYIRQSHNDKKAYLFYKKYSKKFLCVIARHLNGNGFIITTYFTNKIKEGKQIWQKK